MNQIKIKFLGIPSIKFNGVEIQLPFIKAEYIIYLLSHEKTFTRDKLCAIFWGDTKEQIAKKNLRNAIYTIRKYFYNDIIISPKRYLLQIDENIESITDVGEIENINISDELNENQIDDFITIYDGDFLDGIKKGLSIEFDEWSMILSIKYKRLYVEKLKILSNLLIKKNSYILGEKCCKKLIEIEEFEEIGYRNLMIIYINQEKYNEATKIYDELEKKLRENLSVIPLIETRKLYESILKPQVQEKAETEKIDFYGREKEIKMLKDNLTGFINNKNFQSYIIFGEAGVGKTRLIEKAINNFHKELIMIKISCFDVESQFMFKMWDKIFEQLSYLIVQNNINIPSELINNINRSFPTLSITSSSNTNADKLLNNYMFVENYICELFSIISKNNKIIFVVDDLHWGDKNSLELLNKVMFLNRYKIMLLASCRNGYRDEVDKFCFNLTNGNKLSKLELNRFSKIETKNFIHLIMPESEQYSEKIFDESEGNPLFITEMINNLKQGIDIKDITDKMANLIYSRILSISEEAQKLLTICSMFYEPFDIHILIKATGIKRIKLVDLIEELLVKNILKEEKYSDNRYVLIFTHQKIREYIYNGVSNSKRILLHEIIGEYYESKLNNNKIDRIFYSNLIFHFTGANNKYKVFKYEIKGMQVILDVSHEIFPIIEEKRFLGVFEFYADEKILEEKFEKLKELYEELKFQDTVEIYELGIIYFHLYGRYHKDIGNLTKGLDAIRGMIELSLKKEYYRYAFEGYLQLIQYSINTNDLALMESAVENAEKIAKIENDRAIFGLSLRYKGYLNILKGNYIEGERYILHALDLFNSFTDRGKYILNIVAANFYMGESKRLQKKHIDAIELYYKAYELCDEYQDLPALALIYSKIGYANFELESFDEAQFYLLKSLKAYNKTVFSWGRAEVYYYLALIYDKKNLKDKSKNYIELAILLSRKHCNDELNKKAKIFLKNLK